MAAGTCVDVLDFRFKSVAKTKVFNSVWTEFASPLNLVSTSSRFGLVFAGFQNGFKVYQIESLLEAGEHSSPVPSRSITVDGSVRMLHTNCDETLLALVVQAQSGHQVALVYPVSSFLTSQLVQPSSQVMLASTPGQTVSQFAWNPVNPGSFCLCLNDGQVSSFEVKEPGKVSLINTVAASAASVAWSPKGKQLVAATKDGRLCQFMPDLKPARTAGPPDGLGPNIEAVSVVWLSSFQFGVVFKLGGADEQRLSMCIVNAPKTGPVTAQDFDDVCYSSGDLRPHQFYLNHVLPWSVVLVASANGAEVGVLGQNGADWQQWTLEDSARAELPLDAGADTFPLGMALCKSATAQLVWEEKQLPHMPVLLLLSNCGLLSIFHTLNLKGAPDLCQPIEGQAAPGLFNVEALQIQPKATPPAAAPSAPSPQKATPPPFSVPGNQTAPVQQPLPFSMAAAAGAGKMFGLAPSAKPATPPQPSFFSTLPAQVSAPAPQVQAQPAAPAPAPKVEVQAKRPQPDVLEAKKVEPEEPAMSAETCLAITNAILKQFQAELAASLKQSEDTPFKIANSEDSEKMVTLLNTAEEETLELKQSAKKSNQQLSELHNLSLNAIRQSEEARMRLAQRQNPDVRQATRNRPLDPTTQAQKQDIADRLLYIEAQTQQAAATVNQALIVQPFRPSSNMALNKTVLLQRRCLTMLNNRLDLMATQVGDRLPSVISMAELADALPSVTARAQEPRLSIDDERTLSSFLSKKPVTVVKRKAPPPAPSPAPVVRVVSPLKPVPHVEVPVPTRQAPPGATIVVNLEKLLAEKAAAAQPQTAFPSSPFSFASTKPQSEPKPFSLGGEKKPVNLFSLVEGAFKMDKKEPEKAKSPEKVEEKQKTSPVKESSPLLSAALQSPKPSPPKTPLFGKPPIAPDSTSEKPAAPALFATPTSTSASPFAGSNLFAPSSSAATTTANAPLKFSFGSLSTPSSGGGAFSFSSGSSSVFGSTPAKPFATPQPVSAATPVTKPSTTTTPAFSFGPVTATPTSVSSPFGALLATPTTTAAPALLATPTSTTTTPVPLLGSSVTITPLFGPKEATPPAAATTPATVSDAATVAEKKETPSIFGAAAKTPASFATPSVSVTVSTPTPSSTASSLFGGDSSASSKKVAHDLSGIASAPEETPSPLFGAKTATPPATAPPAFPSLATPATPATTTPASVFGAAPAFSSAATRFGSATSTPTTTTASVFGATPAFSSPMTATATSQPASTASSAASTFSFAQAAPQAEDQVTNMFGGMNSGGSMFGSSFSFASASPKPAASIFGGAAPAASPAPEQNLFGGMQACSPSTNKNLFGTQPTSNPFASPKPAASPASNIFGQSPQIGADKPAAAPAPSNLFGQSPATSPPPEVKTGGFGQSGGSLFGQSFSSPTSGQKTLFGSAPVFGQASNSFGAPPMFGSLNNQQQSTFGSPNRIFGSSGSEQAAFQKHAPQPPPDNLFGAAANAPSFGNLAQQGQNQNNNQPSFGGNSFTSWR